LFAVCQTINKILLLLRTGVNSDVTVVVDDDDDDDDA